MCIHGVDSVFGLVLFALQEQKYPLLIEIFPVDLYFMFGDIFFKLFHLLILILIMFYLPEVEESCSLLGEFCFLLFFYLISN